jgi:hypothetical protein
MSELKSYNIFAMRGDPTDDMEVCETLGLDPKLAYTPAINEAAVQKMHKENYNAYVNRGMSAEDALAKADFLADQSRDMIKQVTSNASND